MARFFPEDPEGEIFIHEGELWRILRTNYLDLNYSAVKVITEKLDEPTYKLFESRYICNEALFVPENKLTKLLYA